MRKRLKRRQQWTLEFRNDVKSFLDKKDFTSSLSHSIFWRDDYFLGLNCLKEL
jgi:hypothetical protein